MWCAWSAFRRRLARLRRPRLLKERGLDRDALAGSRLGRASFDDAWRDLRVFGSDPTPGAAVLRPAHRSRRSAGGANTGASRAHHRSVRGGGRSFAWRDLRVFGSDPTSGAAVPGHVHRSTWSAGGSSTGAGRAHHRFVRGSGRTVGSGHALRSAARSPQGVRGRASAALLVRDLADDLDVLRYRLRCRPKQAE